MKGVFLMKRGPYYVPNMGALRGKLGIEIVEILKNTPVPDRTKLKEEVEQLKETIMAARKNVNIDK